MRSAMLHMYAFMLDTFLLRPDMSLSVSDDFVLDFVMIMLCLSGGVINVLVRCLALISGMSGYYEFYFILMLFVISFTPAVHEHSISVISISKVPKRLRISLEPDSDVLKPSFLKASMYFG